MVVTFRAILAVSALDLNQGWSRAKRCVSSWTWSQKAAAKVTKELVFYSTL